MGRYFQAGADDTPVAARGEPPDSVQLLVHDLRQPVAAMCLLLGALRDRDDLPEELATGLQQLGRLTRQLWALLGDPTVAQPPRVVLGSAPGRPGATPRHRSAPVALDALAVDSASAVGSTRLARLVVECDQPVWVRAGGTSLRRALNNMLDNAVKAAGPVGTVRLRVGADDTCGFAQVEDDGPGFGRIPSGTQLGLRVVTQVTQAAGGRVELAASDLGGTSVTLRLPLAPRPRVGTVS